MAHGRITSMRTDRGFGVIRPDDGTDEFFHRTAVLGLMCEQLQPGHPSTATRSPFTGTPGEENHDLRVAR